MSDCDAIREARFLGGTLDERAALHVGSCVRCRADEPALRALAHSLAADAVAEPPATLAERVLHAATPLLARNAHRAAWRTVARAIGAALLALPLVVALDAYVVHAAYTLLRALLPEALSLYLVVNYTALLALLLTLTYGAIPLLGERQVRLRHEEIHG